MVFETVLVNKVVTFFLPTFGIHQVYNALFAIALTHRLGFRPSEIQSGLNTFHKNYSPYFQLDIKKLKDDITFIYYTYDAKPSAMKTGIDVLSNIGKKKNIALLGDMLELGSHSLNEHEKIGKLAVNNKIDFLFTFGEEGKIISESAIKSGFPPHKVTHVLSINELHQKLVKIINPQSTVLLMGYMSIPEQKEIEMIETVYFIRSIYKKEK
jgi:UDP-N-acetylmuramoyl-tripeptide--D-alanyl-D-alanine ligase